MPKILIISSQIHKKLASQQLDLCRTLVEEAGYHSQVELISAGVYEIPFVINTFNQYSPYDGYIALGLILKANLDHYNDIMSHIQHCFTQFALNNIIVGNGILSGSTSEELTEKLTSTNTCLSGYSAALNAVDCLLKLRSKFV